MAKFDRKKFRKELKAKLEKLQVEDIYKDFEGSPVELFFLKLGNFISQNRLAFYSSIVGVLLIVFVVVAWGEYQKSKEEQATLELEKLEKKLEKNPSASDAKIQEYESYLSKHSEKKATLRVSKYLADLYVEKKDFQKAAEYMEKAASLLEEPKEVQALYYSLAGNYREAAKQNKEAIANYQQALNAIGNNKEVPNLLALVFLELGRLRLQEGNKEEGLVNLKKVLEIEPKYESVYLKQLREKATYLIMKTIKG
ncbi:MAG: tetratricopeptide repeat protein [Leptospiraceae bacterium]|nr:tetratricopeptide repeat protein [Leptospiraceae bacterium]